MYYLEKDNQIILFEENIQKLKNTIKLMPQYAGLEIKETSRPIENFQFADTEEYKAEQAQKEVERILALSMTRSDFFDGTIKAFGLDSDDLLPAIDSVLSVSQISEVEQKVALNNYKNALNFYRKHPLFIILSNISIPLTPELSVTVTSAQWDKFFDETSKKNEDAYKYLTSVGFTINPNPSDAIVTINGEVESSVILPYGSEVTYIVEKDGYELQTGTLILTDQTTALTIILVEKDPIESDEPSEDQIEE